MNGRHVHRRRPFLRDVSLVGALTFRELRRHRGAWRLPLLTAVLFGLLFAGSAAVRDRVEERLEVRSFSVAVSSELEGAEQLIGSLTTDRLAPRRVADPTGEVAGYDSAVGLVVGPEADRAMLEGRPVPLQIVVRPDDHVSNEAAAFLEAELDRLEVAAVSADPVPVVEAGLQERSVAEEPEVVRSRFAQTLASLVCFLSLGIVTAVASILGSARDQRATEALLVLPLSRRALASGTAVGAFPVMAGQLLAGVAVFLVAGLIPLTRLSLPIDVLVGALPGAIGGALFLAAVAAGLGVLAGAVGAGGDDAVAVGDLLAVPYLALGLVLFVAPGLDASTPLLLTPVLGGALLVREAVLGQVSLAEFVLVAASSLVTATVLVRVAGWRLGDERQVLRSVG